MGEEVEVGLPGLVAGIDFEKFRVKARGFLSRYIHDSAQGVTGHRDGPELPIRDAAPAPAPAANVA